MKKVIISLLIAIILVNLLVQNTNYAKVTIGEDEFEKAFLENIKEDNYYSYFMDKENNYITVKLNSNEEDIIKYDFSDGIKFSTKVKITKDMDFGEYMQEEYTAMLLGIPYDVIMKMNNVNNTEIIRDYYRQALEFDPYKRLTEELPENSEKINVITYEDLIESLNKYYQNSKVVLRDNGKNGYDTFTLTKEQVNVTTESCELILTLEINMDMDFQGFDKKITDEYKERDKEFEEFVNTEQSKVEKHINENNNTIKPIKTLPQTGKGIETEDVLKIFVSMCVVILAVLIIKDINIKKKSKI